MARKASTSVSRKSLHANKSKYKSTSRVASSEDETKPGKKDDQEDESVSTRGPAKETGTKVRS